MLRSLIKQTLKKRDAKMAKKLTQLNRLRLNLCVVANVIVV